MNAALRRSRTIVLIAALAAVGVVIVVIGALATRGPLRRIGTLLPLAGQHASIGAGMKHAMQLAIDEANHKAGWRQPRFELVALDEGKDDAEGRAAVARLGEDPSILAACANYDEAITFANNDVYHDHGLANLNPGTVDHDITDHIRRRPVWYRVIPGNKLSMRGTIAYAWNRIGARSYAVVQNRDFGSARMAWMYKEAIARKSKAPVLELTVEPDDREFKDPLAHVVGINPDFVLFTGAPEQGAALLLKLRAAGSKATFQLGGKYPAPEFLAVAGEVAEGTLSISEGPMAEDTPAGRAFLQRYAAAGFPVPAGPFGLAAYASMQVLLRAVHNSNLTRASVVGALKRAKFESAMGTVQFDQWGQSLNHDVPLYRVEHGEWTPIQVVDEDEVKPWVEPQ